MLPAVAIACWYVVNVGPVIVILPSASLAVVIFVPPSILKPSPALMSRMVESSAPTFNVKLFGISASVTYPALFVH